MDKFLILFWAVLARNTLFTRASTSRWHLPPGDSFVPRYKMGEIFMTKFGVASRIIRHRLIIDQVVMRSISRYYQIQIRFTWWELRAGRSGDQIPVGTKFFAPVQTGPGAHPPSHTMDTGSFPEIKLPGRGVDHPSTSSAEVKERVELYIYSLFGPSWLVLG